MSDRNTMVAVVFLAVGLAPVVSACGGDGGGSCGKVAPCGGNVTGNWNVSNTCITSSAYSMLGVECPGATIHVTFTHISGTVAFNDDLTYATTTTAAFALQETLPASCLTTTCAALDQQLKEIMAMDPSVLSAGCTGSTTCMCSFTVAPTTSSETGTYSTSGTTLTMTASDGTSESSAYCLQGNELHVMALNPTMPANIDADTVLTRR